MKTKILTIVSVCLALNNISFAGTTIGKTQATAQLASSCTIRADNVSFGELSITNNYPSLSQWGHIKSIANVVKVLCNNKLPYKINGSALTIKGGAVGRFMPGATNANETLQYNVYSNSNLTNGWFADGSSYLSYGVAGGVNGTGTGVENNHTLYFALYSPTVWPGYWPKPDTYSDTYILTLTY